VIAVLWALIEESVAAAVAFGIISAISWGVWGAFLFHLFGLRRRMRSHLGYSLKTATFLDKEVGATRVNDVRQALESLYADKAHRTARYGMKRNPQMSLVFMQEGNTEVSVLHWTTVESQAGDYHHFPTNAVYFLHCDGIPFVACLNAKPEPNAWEFEEEFEGVISKRGERLQVFARTLEESARVLDFIMTEASVRSIYRGKMLHVSPRGPNLPGQLVRVTELPDTERERIVLPEEVLEVIHRAVLARLRHARLLEFHGHSSKTGILLHGMPGTGKTLVSKYLINICTNHTAIVPTGMDTETIREAFRLAVYLQPAIIVIEDVDLLAERRETNANVTGLQELMNELDGLAPSTDAIILMSTNRPEIIEPALAARPGRVSQAVFFPLPSPTLRE
jgi:SpoVK/Ycf46/Vps4 family AAA+-type ATPase